MCHTIEDYTQDCNNIRLLSHQDKQRIIIPRRMNGERNNFGVFSLSVAKMNDRSGKDGAACRPRGRSLKFFIQAGIVTLFQAHASWTRALNHILRGTPGCFCQMTRRWIIHLARIHSDDAAGRKIVIPRLPIKPPSSPRCFPSSRNLSWLIVSSF